MPYAGHMPKITAPDVRGGLAKFARDYVRHTYNCNLDKVLPQSPQAGCLGQVIVSEGHRRDPTHP